MDLTAYSQITYDSRDVQPGALFICKGQNFKKEYLEKAIEAGASAYVSEKDYGADIPAIIVPDIRKAMAEIAGEFYGRAWESFPLIGLTGSKGKSTTLYYIKSIVEDYCKAQGLGDFAYLSTIDTFDGIEQFESHLTTPEALDLHRHFANAKKAGVFAFGMEVSSQGLKYDRVAGVEFSIGCFLNFGSDHIGEGEHDSIEDYFSSKLKLMQQSKCCVINAETDGYLQVLEAARLNMDCTRILTYCPSRAKAHKDGKDVVFEYDGREWRLSMPGLFNAENAICAIIVCRQLGIPDEFIASGLYRGRAAGRMEVFENKERNVVAIVDYAHSILSFDKLFASVKEEYPGFRIEALFGCPGGKGLQRRKDLPETAAKYADYVWITEEDPGRDNVSEICRTVYNNLKAAGGEGEIIENREACVTKAISSACPGTVIVLTGKGREEYMHRGDDYVPIESEYNMVARLMK